MNDLIKMTKEPEDMKEFNLDRFQALRAVSQEQAMAYQKECADYRAEKIGANKSTDEIVELEKDAIETEELEAGNEDTDELAQKEELVKILKDNGMKLASTKWGLKTLIDKVANLSK